jgi:hypothetical protein
MGPILAALAAEEPVPAAPQALKSANLRTRSIGVGCKGPMEVLYQLSRGLLREARNRTRTDDPFLTMEVLYQLSYPGRFWLYRAKKCAS